MMAPHRRILYTGVVFGLLTFLAGATVDTIDDSGYTKTIGIALQSLGAAIIFPILVSFAYDRLRERLLGDEVWRLFAELSDAGIIRVYRDREFALGRDNAQTRLSEEFLSQKQGEILIMGSSLRVFFNPLGPFYRDIETILNSSNGNIEIKAIISRNDSPSIQDRIAVEQPTLPPDEKPQHDRDCDSTISAVRKIATSIGPNIALKRVMPAPYCTAVVFPGIAFYSPNMLSTEVPVRMPMILFRAGSHGYNMIKSQFEHLWNEKSSQQVVP
ncbi:hypothetical protein SAMN05216270_119113 [Glycomyces harbinensis]|uniref:Uncharacterized protein n=2 Tax=Glycomyces harbinensis TaxID=58114 RepID=A0A1G7CEK5_9ACTN|nr:hypothetical protein SAMN05216270_119113 [Glycomyces harbinensis]